MKSSEPICPRLFVPFKRCPCVASVCSILLRMNFFFILTDDVIKIMLYPHNFDYVVLFINKVFNFCDQEEIVCLVKNGICGGFTVAANNGFPSIVRGKNYRCCFSCEYRAV